jgi:hypothetical protein
MTCFAPQPLYVNNAYRGIKSAASRGDGHTIDLTWYKAIPDRSDYIVAYNIYYSTIREDVFTEGVKFAVIDPDVTQASLTGFTPGDTYFFAVQGTEHESGRVNLASLPEEDGLRIYTEAALRSNITDTAVRIPVQDVDQFATFGLVIIGAEIIGYSSRDLADGYLVLSSVGQRGLYGTEPRLHTTDGYDGVRFYDNQLVRTFVGWGDDNRVVNTEHNKFDTYAKLRIGADGYKGKTEDILTTPTDAIEASQEGFFRYCFAGYRRTHPADLLAGKCVRSYYGGEHCCADGYDEIGGRVRGLSFTDHNNQRQEVILETTGEPVVLIRRMWVGKYSAHYSNTRENTAHRGLDTHGGDKVLTYEPFYNSRRSDGRIMVRFGPAKEDLVRTEAGLESEVTFDCWTMAFPPIKDSDVLIRFTEDGSEEFRYEVIDVTRNRTVLLESGAQKFTVKRVRKTDPIYQFRAIRDTSTMPTTIVTSLDGVSGPGGIIPHQHQLVVNEGIVSLVQVNQTTSVAQGHDHSVIDGAVQEVLGHTHTVLFP